ncbi:MAG: thiamine pyrophosphate-requiring protein [SAR202 cluster bacterium]|nr:thiamine pyrophosphate-requiring protein [SAR202 cluster bacterium]|tara:strand:+ start:33424 stop:35067 length:1644 start_codon:yes stop_codon:yes gene_type:complete
MNGDQLMASLLKKEGTEWISCFPAQTLIEACSQEGIRPILCRQERAGVNMADAYSRIHNGNKIGVFTMQHGPGAENAFGGVAQAYADNVPMLLIPGGSTERRVGVHPGFDAIPNYQHITKWAGRINTIERIPEMVSQAFTHLRNGRLGPVLLELPGDVAHAEVPADIEEYQPSRSYKSYAANEDVRDIVTALLRAEAPVINAGQGTLYAEATDELIEFAELVNVPVMTTLAGKSAYPEDHHLALGTGGNTGTLMVDRFLQNTDFVLGIGTSFAISNFTAPMPPEATKAQITNTAEDINRDYRVEYGAVGDAKLVLQQLIEETKSQLGEHGRGDVHGVKEKISIIKEEFMKEWGPRLNSDETPMSPYRVFNEMMKAIDPRNAIVTHDSGYPRNQLVPFWPALTPRSYIGWGKSTQLGYGLGLALGAKVAAPDKLVINVMGDAAFGMSGLDIETASRSGLGTITIVLNNGVMTHYYDHFPHATENWKSNELGGIYSDTAKSLGAHGERIHNPDEIGPAMTRAVETANSGQPVLLEMITKEEENISTYGR